MSERGQRTQRAIEEAVAALERALYLDLDDAYDDGLADAECTLDHCEDGDCDCGYREAQSLDGVDATIEDYLRKIRMGYTIDESLEDILLELKEEMK